MAVHNGFPIRVLVASLLVALPSNTVVAQNVSQVSLYGKVTHDAAPIRRAGDRVFAITSTTPPQQFGPALTDNTGTYYFYSLPGGPYTIQVWTNGQLVWVNRVQLPHSDEYDIEVAK